MTKKIILMFACLSLLGFITPAYAVTSSGGHASGGGHASASHATASHATTSHSTASRGVTSRPTTSSGRPTTTSRPTSQAASRLPVTRSSSQAIKNAEHSNTYRGLTSSQQRSSYAYYRGYYGTYYPNQSINYIMRNNYYWVPYWLLYSNSAEANHLRKQAKQQHLKWITVSGKSVAVSPKLYDKIKVGDHVQLIDDTHIKINHHVYKR